MASPMNSSSSAYSETISLPVFLSQTNSFSSNCSLKSSIALFASSSSVKTGITNSSTSSSSSLIINATISFCSLLALDTIMNSSLKTMCSIS